MTDDQMDARLRAAGERWRAANTAVADVAHDTADEPVEHSTRPPRPPRRRRYGLVASAAVVVAALVTGGVLVLNRPGGGPAPAGDTVPLEGHVWLVGDGHGSPSSAALYVDGDGNLVADDECVLIGGKATTDGSTLSVSDEVVRYKSCTDQYGPGFYQDGIALLGGTSTYSISADGLTISRGDQRIAFTVAPDGTPAPTLDFPTLTDTDWLLVSEKGPDGNDIPVIRHSVMRIHDGVITGTDGCNGLEGNVVVHHADSITFGSIGGTLVSCGGVGDAIDAFMTGTAKVTVVGAELTMAKGSAELVYRWNPASAATDASQLHGVIWHLVDDAGTAIPADTTVDFSDGNWELNNGTLSPGSGASGALADLLHPSVNPWFVHDGRLSVLFNAAQAGALVFASSAPLEQPPPAAVQNWHLVDITAGTGRYRNGAPPEELSTLTFGRNSFTVTHTCYAYSGTMSRHGGVGAISATHISHAHPCPEAAGRDAAASLVDSILHGTVRTQTGRGTLTITNPGVGTLVYSTSPPRAEKPLIGTHWRLETVDDNGTDRVATNQSMRIAGGRLVAEDGTNAINADVRIDAATIRLTNLAVGGAGSTTDDPVRDTMDRVLQGTVAYQIVDTHLTITSGLSQLIYRAAGS